MFKFCSKDPFRKLQERYEATLTKARDAQRSGKMPLYARYTEESVVIAAEIEELRKRH